MPLKKRTRPLTPREDTRRALTKSTGATALTYLNRNRLSAPLKTAAAKKILEENALREAAQKALKKKRRATAAGRKRS